MSVSELDALVGKGLLASLSMFNRICRSIFTREKQAEQGLAKSKGPGGRADLGQAGWSVGSTWVEPEEHCVQQREASRGRTEGWLGFSLGWGPAGSCLLG